MTTSITNRILEAVKGKDTFTIDDLPEDLQYPITQLEWMRRNFMIKRVSKRGEVPPVYRVNGPWRE